MKLRTLLLTAFLAFLSSEQLYSEKTEPAKKNEALTFHATDLKDDTYQIEAFLDVPVPEQLLWRTITEYEKTPEFVYNIKESKVLSRKDNNVVLDMKGEGRVLYIITVKLGMLLDLVEHVSQKKLDFVETSHETFLIFKGYWEVSKKGEKSTIHLSLTAKPKQNYFGLTRKIIDYSVEALFDDIQKKVLKEYAPQSAPKAASSSEEKK